MKWYTKTFLWTMLPVLIVLAFLEAIWVEAYRIITDSKFLQVLNTNYVKIKQIYTQDIWE
jgi:hypothetical protein